MNPKQAKAAHQGGRVTLMHRLRTYFFAGVLVTAPVGITLFVAWAFIEFVDKQVSAMLPATMRLDFPFPGLGLLVIMILLTAIGAMTAGVVGRMIVRWGEHLLQRVPVVRNIHSALKQIMETILAQQSNAFRQVVLVEYPRRGIWALAFITGVTKGEVQNLTENECINVFLPTTPNPTSGFLLFVPREDLVVLDMSVEEGIKMVISGGIVTPPDRRPAEVQKVPLVAAAPEDPLPASYRGKASSENGLKAPIRIEESEPPHPVQTDKVAS